LKHCRNGKVTNVVVNETVMLAMLMDTLDLGASLLMSRPS